MASKWIVSLLSTDYDLHEHRTALLDLLNDAGFIPSAFETADFPVDPNVHSHNACLVALDRVDIAVIIIDRRSGGLYVDSHDVTITEQEYFNIANAQKPHLVFVSRGAWDERHSYRTQLKLSGKLKEEFDKSYVCTYVASYKIFEFIDEIQNAYSTRNTSNWITQFDGIEDLKGKLVGKLSGLSRYFCSQIMQKQKQRIERRHTSTSMLMTLGDVISRNYYIEPDYDIQSGNLADGTTLDERIINALVAQSSTLVIGEAGYGKTTILAKSFLRHVSLCISTSSYSIPFYITLKSKGGEYHFDFDQFIDECFADDLGKEKFPLLVLDSIRPYFYLDGFDEIAEKLSNDELGRIGNSSIIGCPFLLTCRIQYAQRYIQNIDFSDKITNRIFIKPWSITKAREYIHNFCTIRNRVGLISDINAILTDNTELNSIMDNPLIITMLLWIIENNGLKMPETIKSRVHIFVEYLEELAHRELERLRINSVSVKQLMIIWSFAAWEVYYSKLRKSPITFFELLESLNTHLSDIPHIYNESWFEALFVSYREHINGTFHEQFLEFLSANAVLNACVTASYPYPEFLSHVIRPEINRYFRALWGESTSAYKDRIVANIRLEYLRDLLDDDHVLISRRVHSVYHLSRLDFVGRDAFINNALSKETHISVRLSLYFGAIKSGDLVKEEELFQLLIGNAEYSDANRGYHLAYYNDIIIDDKLPFRDNPSISWNGTLDAFLRHFSSPDEGHYFLRRIDLLTMQQLYEARQGNPLLDDTVIERFESLIRCPISAKHPEFQAKIEQAFKTLVLVWKSLCKQTHDH